MKYIDSLHDGMHVSGVYLCKTKTIALTKNGKEFYVLKFRSMRIRPGSWKPRSGI